MEKIPKDYKKTPVVYAKDHFDPTKEFVSHIVIDVMTTPPYVSHTYQNRGIVDEYHGVGKLVLEKWKAEKLFDFQECSFEDLGSVIGSLTEAPRDRFRGRVKVG